MKARDDFRISDDHSIEWGNATWDENDTSIRNRYDNAKGGKFNYAGSGEIPWADFITMIHESIRRNHFSDDELKEIEKLISNRRNS